MFGAGLLSDKFGRKATLGPIGIALGTVGLVTAAMPSVEAFVALRLASASICGSDTGQAEQFADSDLDITIDSSRAVPNWVGY